MQYEIFLDKTSVIKWVNSPKKRSDNIRAKKIRFVDLFSGCGGLSHGIVKAALKNNLSAICALAVDLNSAPLEVFRDNIPHEKGSVLNANIVDLFSIKSKEKLSKREKSLKEKVGSVDVLVAGPPCQGHSNLNNSTRRSDPRNSLYLACIRAVELFEPKLVIIENVPSVVHSVEGVVQEAEKRFVKLGYKVKHMNINFLDLGIPQSRRRHVLMASKDVDFYEKVKVASRRRQVPTLREFIYKIKKEESLLFKPGKLSEVNMKRVRFLFENNLFDLPDAYRPSCHRDRLHSYKSVYGRLQWDKPAQTLTSGYGSMGQGRYIHPSETRTINSREAARIQGFPDYYSFSSVSSLTDLREMIANAVPPQLTYVIFDRYLSETVKKGRRLVKSAKKVEKETV